MKKATYLSFFTLPMVLVFFLSPIVQLSADDREVIRLSSQERDYFLHEMRQFLFSINGVMAGLAGNDSALTASSARKSGDAYHREAGRMEPALEKKLPAPFLKLRAATHADFDALAHSVEQKEEMQTILTRITNITGKCVACHTKYRVSP